MPPNLVIRASAGTGKTFQLSNRFLGLVAAGEPLESILAVTFTRKGAGEILDRVLLRLAQAASDPAEAAALGRFLEVRGLDQQRCQALLEAMLRGLHRLRTGTLDSFFIQVARAFSLELGQPHGWQIADEILDGRLRAEAIRTVLREESTGDVVRLMNLLTKGEAARLHQPADLLAGRGPLQRLPGIAAGGLAVDPAAQAAGGRATASGDRRSGRRRPARRQALRQGPPTGPGRHRARRLGLAAGQGAGREDRPGRGLVL